MVNGADAQIARRRSDQPTMLVKGLKLGDVSGGIASFVGPGTDGYFKNPSIDD